MLRVTREHDALRRDIAMVESLLIRAEARGKGIGRGRVRRCVARAKPIEGLTTLTLTVENGQDAARRPHLNSGFRRTGLFSGGIRVEGRSIDEETKVRDLQ